MPNTKSAAKDMRTSKIRNVRNNAVKNRVRTAVKKLNKATESGSGQEQQDKYNELCSVVDKAVKKGALKANAAARRKSRATRKLREFA